MSRQGKPSLLVLASTYPRWAGDAEPGFVHELSRRLADDFEVHVIAPHAAGAHADEVLDGVAVHRYRYAPERMETLVHGGGIINNLRRRPWKFLLVPGFVLGQWLAVRRARRRWQPALVHAHWLLPQGIVASAAAGDVPFVVTSHGADLFALRSSWFARLRRFVVRRAAMVTVVSHAMQAKLAREAPSVSVRVLPMGVDTQRTFTPDPQMTRSDHRLLFVGRLVEKKGVRHLIEAMPTVLARRPSIELVIAGAGPELAALKQLVDRLGVATQVRFVGAMTQAELAPLYRQATLFVAPFIEAESGDQEGLGLVVAEAMACGCPVLVGDVPAVRDLVNDETGVRVPGKDSAALADAIEQLLADPVRRGRFALNSRKYVEEHYGWDRTAAGYRDLLRSVMCSGPAKK